MEVRILVFQEKFEGFSFPTVRTRCQGVPSHSVRHDETAAGAATHHEPKREVPKNKKVAYEVATYSWSNQDNQRADLEILLSTPTVPTRKKKDK